jgi:hypothetical protein
MNVVSSDIKHHISLHHKTVYKLLNNVLFFFLPQQQQKTVTCTYSTENEMLVNIYRTYKCIYPNEVGMNLASLHISFLVLSYMSTTAIEFHKKNSLVEIMLHEQKHVTVKQRKQHF